MLDDFLFKSFKVNVIDLVSFNFQLLKLSDDFHTGSNNFFIRFKLNITNFSLVEFFDQSVEWSEIRPEVVNYFDFGFSFI